MCVDFSKMVFVLLLVLNGSPLHICLWWIIQAELLHKAVLTLNIKVICVCVCVGADTVVNFSDMTLGTCIQAVCC